MQELEVVIKFKYTPDPENYDHLNDSSDIEGIIETDVEAIKDDPYILQDLMADKDVEITITPVGQAGLPA